MEKIKTTRPPTLPTRRWAHNRMNMAIFTALALTAGLLAVALGLALAALEASKAAR